MVKLFIASTQLTELKLSKNLLPPVHYEFAMSKSWCGKFPLILNIKSKILSAQAIHSLKSPIPGP
jgi:hypothetical protein